MKLQIWIQAVVIFSGVYFNALGTDVSNLRSPVGTSVYDVNLSGLVGVGQNSTCVYCIARPGANQDSLQNGLNWACGPGRANCTAIQQGQSCYSPNTLQNHASYAYNDYYQRSRSSGGTCDFGGSATLTTVDPSYGSCRFTESLNSSSGRRVRPTSGSSRKAFLFGAIVAAVAMLI